MAYIGDIILAAYAARCKIIMVKSGKDVLCTRKAVAGDVRCKRHGGMPPVVDTVSKPIKEVDVNKVLGTLIFGSDFKK